MLRKLNKLMGCVCSKGILSNEDNAEERDIKLSKSSKKFVSSFKRDEVVVEHDGVGNEATARLIPSPLVLETEKEGDKKGASAVDEKHSKPLQRRATADIGGAGASGQIQQQPRMGRVGSFSHGERGAPVVAGWPSWLSSVAGEAINGWIPRSADSFEKLEKVYSCIFLLPRQFASYIHNLWMWDLIMKFL